MAKLCIHLCLFYSHCRHSYSHLATFQPLQLSNSHHLLPNPNALFSVLLLLSILIPSHISYRFPWHNLFSICSKRQANKRKWVFWLFVFALAHFLNPLHSPPHIKNWEGYSHSHSHLFSFWNKCTSTWVFIKTTRCDMLQCSFDILACQSTHTVYQLVPSGS